MNPYALYPLTNQRKVSHVTGLAEAISIAAYQAVNAAVAAGNWLARRYTRKISIRELSTLSDHMLKDIGIGRHEIPTIVDGLLDAQTARPVPPKPAHAGRSAKVVSFVPRRQIPVADNDNNKRKFSAMI